jgi:agmatine deiminase
MPDESAPHQRTWMAFGASTKVWGNKLLPEVQRNLALIANTISGYEPVSMLVRQTELALARRLLAPAVELVVLPLDDLWIRDTGPVFVVNQAGSKAAVDFNFNGWGEKQAFAQDAAVARLIARQAQVESRRAALVLEGGAIEVDGRGTAIVSESCVVIDNRNPGLTQTQCERELQQQLGVQKVIWIPGIKGKDITDGHTDFYARFARPGMVMAGYDPDTHSYEHAVTQRHIAILRGASDAQGRKLDVITLSAPETVRKTFETAEFAAGYLGFYVCNGAVIAQEFGDRKADQAALDALRHAFPGRKIVQINIDGIAAGGGSLHCTTQQEPVA